jgi:hypothetical protein
LKNVYLDHLGVSDATFRPATWNLGDFRPKETFFAAWQVDARDLAPGVFRASVVALSEGRDPVRLRYLSACSVPITSADVTQ